MAKNQKKISELTVTGHIGLLRAHRAEAKVLKAPCFCTRRNLDSKDLTESSCIADYRAQNEIVFLTV